MDDDSIASAPLLANLSALEEKIFTLEKQLTAKEAQLRTANESLKSKESMQDALETAAKNLEQV